MFAYEAEKKKNVVRDLHQLLRSKLTGEEWRKFDRQKMDCDRVKFLLGIRKAEIMACVENHFRLHAVPKDKSKAMVLKNSGNKAYREGNTEGAMKLYSDCLVWMPQDDSKDAAIVYANRCACLFHLGEYILALQDAEIAFTLDYPAELQYKLHERVGRCCLMLGMTKESTKRFQLAIKALGNTGMDRAKKAKLKNHLEDLMRNNMYPNPVVVRSDARKTKLPEITGGRGRYLRNASKRCAVQRNDNEGRFIIATEDIQPGDVLFVEKAYATTLDQDFCHRQCAQCFIPLQAPVVCKNCVVASYCSPNCKVAAWNSHHKFECPITAFLHRSGVSVICYLAIRILTQSNPLDALSWYDLVNATEMEEYQQKEINDKNGKHKDKNGSREAKEDFYGTDHAALFSLVTHSGKRNTEENFHRTVMTLFLLFTLKKTDIFKTILQQKLGFQNENGKKKPSDEITEEIIELKLATIIFRSLKFLQFNTYELTAWDTAKEKSVYVGGGLFNTLSLCNHSCAPAVSRYFINDTVVVRAIRTIYKGEQITGNYGPFYATSTKQERQLTLMNVFWFKCQCFACTHNWPTFEEMSKQDTVCFRCGFCRNFICQSNDASMNFVVPCPNCLQMTNILKALKSMNEIEGTYKQVSDLIEAGKVEKALEIIFNAIARLDVFVHPPFKNYHIWQETAKVGFLHLGNKVYPPVTERLF